MINLKQILFISTVLCIVPLVSTSEDNTLKPKHNTSKPHETNSTVSENHIINKNTSETYIKQKETVVKKSKIDNVNHAGNTQGVTPEELTLSINDIPSCQSLPLDLENCEISICYEEAPFGKIFRKVLGAEKNQCKYIERADNFGGLNCLIPQQILTKAANLFNSHYKNLYDSKVVSSDQQISNLKNIYKKFCEIIPDSNFKHVISINKKRYEGELRDISKIDLNSKNKNLHKKKAEQKDKKDNSIDEKLGYKSLMFTYSEVQDIMQAIKYYMNLKHLEHEIVTHTHSTHKPKVAFFYLNSLIYLGDDSWVVWLNDHKLGDTSIFGLNSNNNPKTNPDNISIVKVKPNYVTFLWSTKELEQISPGWNLRLTKKKDYYISSDGKIKIYQDGPKSHDVYFTLGANQTFYVGDLSIVEGDSKEH